MYVPLTKSLFKSAGITVSDFFSMLLSTLKYLHSVEPVRMHFPAKQPCTNDTVCNAACSITHFCFSLSVSFHQCCLLIVIYMLLFSKEQTVKAGKPSRRATLYLKSESIRHEFTLVPKVGLEPQRLDPDQSLWEQWCTIHKEKSNKMQQSIKILLFHIYMKLNVFRATHRPSSGTLCLTTSTNYTSNNLPRMKNQRLPVQF